MPTTAGFQLRDYQRECLAAIRSRYLEGVRRQLICLPTGTGKTVIFSQFPDFFRMKNRMLVLAHREELLDQARHKLLQVNPGLRVDVEQANRTAASDSQVVAASVATLGRTGSKRLSQLVPDQFHLIVVDEAHHAAADSYRRVLEHFGVFHAETRKLVVGFTATPKRGDGQGLDQVFQEITFARELPEMIESGYLSPVAAWRVETDVDLSGVRSRMGDFVTGQLSQAVNIQERNRLVVKIYQERLQGRKTLCFCVDVAHAEELAAEFRSAGIAAGCVTGELGSEERSGILGAFRSGQIQVLTNCMVLTEGYDEPSVEGIILARPTKSAALYMQMIGRGTRLYPGKRNVTVVDVVDMTRDQRLVHLTTLFGLPPKLNLEGRTTQEVRNAFRWAESNRPWVRLDTVKSLSELRYRCQRIKLFDLETPEEIEEESEYAWTRRGEQSYGLSLSSGERLSISATILNQWEVSLIAGNRETPMGQGRDLREAIRLADQFVAREREDSRILVTREIRWRHQPATSKQLSILKERHIEAPPSLTKGQASQVIGMLPRKNAEH